MSFKDVLEIAKTKDIDAIMLLVATEVEFQLQHFINAGKITKVQAGSVFEDICNEVENAYLKSEKYSIVNLSLGACALVIDDKIDVKTINKNDIYDKVDEL